MSVARALSPAFRVVVYRAPPARSRSSAHEPNAAPAEPGRHRRCPRRAPCGVPRSTDPDPAVEPPGLEIARILEARRIARPRGGPASRWLRSAPRRRSGRAHRVRRPPLRPPHAPIEPGLRPARRAHKVPGASSRLRHCVRSREALNPIRGVARTLTCPGSDGSRARRTNKSVGTPWLRRETRKDRRIPVTVPFVGDERLVVGSGITKDAAGSTVLAAKTSVAEGVNRNVDPIGLALKPIELGIVHGRSPRQEFSAGAALTPSRVTWRERYRLEGPLCCVLGACIPMRAFSSRHEGRCSCPR